ncbi:flagellar type III secretion system pore protein FliP [Mahella australiensis]|uniref:Flagellar biosynthetic protein FliP n=1 Tax=Mahella australiensis (strain DSM 15567 / CIP 107919 / 50-1 BON) TaxID=697281 RepID=F4A1V2_MAHA5|nr:flagellar type III secretion system pore protein FliP [Mahella australiensis]AEE96068.1 flagellar biosynthetic protein FliP [Mahella australiensis 50-1 BON]
MRRIKVRIIVLFIIVILAWALSGTNSAYAAPEIPIPNINVDIEPAQTPQETALSLQILLLLTILSLAPAILIMLTSFTRIIVVLSFVRSALGLQQMPPNQVIIGLALFLTFFTMAPVATQINQTALQPYMNGQIEQQQAIDNAMVPLREFMFKETREKDLNLFVNLSGMDKPEQLSDISSTVLIPAFIISELKTAFQIGFLIYVPFIVIDMVVATTLMSMGMMMIPPVMISLPFKVLLFIMVDGWNLVVQSLITSFH